MVVLVVALVVGVMGGVTVLVRVGTGAGVMVVVRVGTMVRMMRGVPKYDNMGDARPPSRTLAPLRTSDFFTGTYR